MGEFFAALWEYIWTVILNWVFYMTAIPLVLDDFIRWLSPKASGWIDAKLSRANRRKIEIAFMVVGFVVANFLAFDGERQERIKLEMADLPHSGAAQQITNLQSSLEQEREESAAQIKKQQEEIDSLKMAAAPLPFKDRLKTCLQNIDPTILTRLAEGVTQFQGGIKPYQASDLEKLCSENGSTSYIQFTETGIGGGPQGNVTIVSFTLSKDLLTP